MSTRTIFVEGEALGVTALLLCMISLMLMTLDLHVSGMTKLRGWLTLGVAPIQYVARAPSTAVDFLARTLASRQRLLDENTALKAAIEHSHFQMQAYQALKSENSNLQQLLAFSKNLPGTVKAVRLLADQRHEAKQQMMLDAGTRDGVHAGQVVFDQFGIAGQIISTNFLSSSLMLITDPQSAIPILDNQTGIRAIAEGANDHLLIKGVVHTAKVAVGDVLLTSGLGGRFPMGFPVAIVSSVEKNPHEQFDIIRANPIAHLDTARHFLLYWQKRVEVPVLKMNSIEPKVGNE